MATSGARDVYLSIKALHVIAIISWMAGLLYLPRLFVYHSDVAVGSPQSELFKIMEKRLYRYIMNPALIVAAFSGFYVGYAGGFFYDAWFISKLILVFGLVSIHFLLGRHVKDFQTDRSTKGSRYFRVLNEAPTLLMVAIVILVVVKPF